MSTFEQLVERSRTEFYHKESAMTDDQTRTPKPEEPQPEPPTEPTEPPLEDDPIVAGLMEDKERDRATAAEWSGTEPPIEEKP